MSDTCPHGFYAHAKCEACIQAPLLVECERLRAQLELADKLAAALEGLAVNATELDDPAVRQLLRIGAARIAYQQARKGQP
ncbi:hypothetical protein HY375_00660 [Candidatus Berkelbacteria bacterium]|nr:hypothetical protein [Candidatus Berkelbacteria bacterium]